MTEIKKWRNHKGIVLDALEGFDVIECETCNFKHIIPIPSSQDLNKMYRDEYYSVEKPCYLERHRQDLDWWNMVYCQRYDAFEHNLPLDHRSVLDIGSGPGYFLLHGKNRGWKTLGIEPSDQATAHGQERGLKIINGFYSEEMAASLGTFDVIHMSNVLEHIPDPKHLIQLVRKNLAVPGLICISVPNDYNPFQQALREVCDFQPWWVAPPHHINYFDFTSLGRLLSACGFTVIQNEASFPIDMFLLMGDNYVNNDQVGQQCHNRRKAFELNLSKTGSKGIMKELYQKFADLGIGREAIVLAVTTET